MFKFLVIGAFEDHVAPIYGVIYVLGILSAWFLILQWIKVMPSIFCSIYCSIYCTLLRSQIMSLPFMV